MPLQSPGAGAVAAPSPFESPPRSSLKDVNTIPAVPSATSAPSLTSIRSPAANFTMARSPMVRVEPAGMPRGPLASTKAASVFDQVR